MNRDRLVRALAVVVVVASALNIGLALTRPDPVQEPTTRGEGGSGALAGRADAVVDAAARTAALASTYDYRRLARDLDAAAAGMTPQLAERFRAGVAQGVAPQLRRDRAVVRGEVDGAGFVRFTGDGDGAVCVVYVDQVLISGRQVAAGQTRSLREQRVVVRLVADPDADADERWRVAELRPF